MSHRHLRLYLVTVFQFAGAEHGSRVVYFVLNPRGERVRGPKYAPRGPFYFLEHLHGLAEIIERGTVVLIP